MRNRGACTVHPVRNDVNVVRRVWNREGPAEPVSSNHLHGIPSAATSSLKVQWSRAQCHQQPREEPKEAHLTRRCGDVSPFQTMHTGDAIFKLLLGDGAPTSPIMDSVQPAGGSGRLFSSIRAIHLPAGHRGPLLPSGGGPRRVVATIDERLAVHGIGHDIVAAAGDICAIKDCRPPI